MKIVKKILLPEIVKCMLEDGSIMYEFYEINEVGKEYVEMYPKHWKTNIIVGHC